LVISVLLWSGDPGGRLNLTTNGGAAVRHLAHDFEALLEKSAPVLVE